MQTVRLLRHELAAGFLAASLACAQMIGSASAQRVPAAPQPPAPEVRPEDKCSIEGSVLNAKTGDPLKKAQVVLFRNDAPGGDTVGAVSDAAGKFKVTNLDPGRYMINITRNGFARPNFGAPSGVAGSSPSTLTLVAGQALTKLVYKLQPAAVISGRVIDEDNEPVANAQIQALQYRFMRGERQLLPAGMAQTDDLGQFRLHGLMGGRYYVKAAYTDPASMMGFAAARHQEQPDDAYAPVYYPGVLDASQAVPLTVREGEEKRAVDFRLTPVRTVRVRGRVIGVSSDPTRMAMVTLASRGMFDFGGRRMQRVARDGAFEIRGVVPGSYNVVAYLIDPGGARLSGRKSLEVAEGNVEGVEVVLRAGTEVSGVVRLEELPPDSQTKLENLHVRLNPEDFMMFGGPMEGGDVDAEGRFTLKNIADGEYRPFIYPSTDVYIASVRYGDADVTDKALSIGDGVAAPIEIVVRGDGGTIDATVFDSDRKPVANAAVVTVRDGKPNLGGQTDQYGKVTIRALRPGEYIMYAFAGGGDSGAWQDPALLEKYKDSAKTVKLDARATQTIELQPANLETQ